LLEDPDPSRSSVSGLRGPLSPGLLGAAPRIMSIELRFDPAEDARDAEAW
jgi:hypothetical protein